jgi:hypothetical protein
MKNNNVTICILLTIVFVILKLFGAINWSWWWVFSPLWIFWAIVLGFVILCLAFVVLMIIMILVLSIMATIFKK